MTIQQKAQFCYKHIIEKVATGAFAKGDGDFAEEVAVVAHLQLAAGGIDFNDFNDDEKFAIMDKLATQIVARAKELQAA